MNLDTIINNLTIGIFISGSALVLGLPTIAYFMM